MANPDVTGFVHLPKAGANEVSGIIKRWAVDTGQKVRRGDLLAEIETTKAVVEVEAESDGWFFPLAERNDSAEVGTVIGVIAARPEIDLETVRREAAATTAAVAGDPAPTVTTAPAGSDTWTRKAVLLAERHHLDRTAIAAQPRTQPGRVSEADVLAFLERQKAAAAPSAFGLQRVLVVGSAGGGGAAIVIDSLARCPGQVPVGVVDRDESWHGKPILGVPVLGPSDPDLVLDLYRRGTFDAVVLAFNRSIEARAETFADLAGRGIPFANVVDPTVNMRLGVRLGVGNVILGSSYLGAEAEIGDNNFLSSNTCIEHHCRMGSHNAFGPAVAFSGRVVIGDRIRFGTQIAVEPGVRIGSDCVIASSCVLRTDIPDRSLVRAKVSYAISPVSGSND